jgi:hypothetical protein
VAVAGDLVGEVPRDDARVDTRLDDVEAHAPDRAAALLERARRPRARRVDRADALPDEDAGRVEAVEQRITERVLAARRVGADRLQARDDRVHVGVAQRVAAAGRVLLQRGAAQAQRLPVEQQRPAGPAQLAQADAGVERRLAGDLHVQRLQRGVAGLPQVGVVDARLRPCDALRAGAEAQRVEVQLGPRQHAAHLQRARAGAVGDADGDVDDRGGAVQVGHDRRRIELGAPERADGHRAIDAAEVEPCPVPRVGLHRRRIAPVGAHDEHVRAGSQARASLEGQVDAGVVRDLATVDPHGREVVDRVEADRVGAVVRRVDRRAIPGDRALEGARAGGAADVARVRREGDGLGAPGEPAARPAQREPAVGMVAADDPWPVERVLAGGRGGRRHGTRRAALLADRACHDAQNPERDRQADSQDPQTRARHRPPDVAAAQHCPMRVDGLLTTLLTTAGVRRLRWREKDDTARQSSSMATTRAGAALPPTIRSGKQLTTKPLLGRAPRLNSRSICE